MAEVQLKDEINFFLNLHFICVEVKLDFPVSFYQNSNKMKKEKKNVRKTPGNVIRCCSTKHEANRIGERARLLPRRGKNV